MATYYVSPYGSDSNNGLGPDPGHASNKPWLTVGKALGASGIASGDTVYICPGTYRQAVTVAMTSPVAETFVLGDPLNAQGFKDGSNVLVAPGEVRITNATTDDKTLPGNSSTISLTSKNYLTFQYLTINDWSNSSSVYAVALLTCTNVKLLDCCIVCLWGCVYATCSDGVAATHTIARCRIFSIISTPVAITPATGAGSDWSMAIAITNCLIIGADYVIYSTPSGSASGKPGGISVINCTLLGRIGTGAQFSVNYPLSVKNTLLIRAGLIASSSGQIVDDGYNLILAQTPFTNVTDNTATNHTVISKAYTALLNLGQESLWLQGVYRPCFSPALNSPILGFGNATSPPADDLLGLARPSGPGPTWGVITNAVGCFEHHDFGAKETTTIDGASGAALRLTGPGDMIRRIAVNAASTTISVKGRYDSNHADTNKPQVQLMPAPEIGYAGQTLTMSVAADNWETLSFTGFTPTAKGYVRIRFISRSAAGNGNAYFDTLAVS